MNLEKILEYFSVLSQWAIPAIIVVILLSAARARVPVYESFVTGAKEGFGIAIGIIPFLVAMLVVIAVFRASGLFTDIKWVLGSALTYMGFDWLTPTMDLIPLALTRPLSGSGARAVLIDLFQVHKPDSYLGNTGSIMMGSTETTFYILTVYYGSIGVKKIRHTLPACLIADAVGIVAAVVVGSILYG